MNQSQADTQVVTIVQISDVHLLSPSGGDEASCHEKRERFEEVFRLALAQQPDRIVLSGDLTENGFDDINELTWAKDVLAEVDTPPVLLIPGNHDVGDKPGTGPNAIDASRLANWNSVFGSDHFIEDIAHWRLIGLNSLLVNSGLPEEAQQLHWLDLMIEQAQRLGQLVAIFMHEPPFVGTPGRTFGNLSDYWAIAPDKQADYLKRFAHPNVKLVANGHVHWHNAFARDGALHCWCPSPAFIVDDPNFPRGGDVTGLLVYKLGSSHASVQLVPYHYNKAKTQVIQFHGAEGRE